MATPALRRAVKTVDKKHTFSFPAALNRRRKSFSYITLAIIVTGLVFLRAPGRIVSQTEQSADPITKGVSIRDTSIQTVVSKDELRPPSIPDEERDVGNDVSEKVSNAGEHEQPILTRGEAGKCLKHIVYDKPVKTGSTAIMFAIRNYLNETDRKDYSCSSVSIPSCIDLGQQICNGSVKEADRFSLLGHFQYATKQLVDCLRPNYYYATSVRDPYQRRKSAYLWNRTTNGSHFAIPYTVSFREFMERLPRCQLYHYYDGHGHDCDNAGMPLEQRIQEIVDRVDEVLDVYDEPVGPLHRLVAKYLERENESIKVEEKEYLEDFDKDTLKEEQMLYERLRELRLKSPDMNRLPC